MTSPSPSDPVLVRPAAVSALAGELTGLAAELRDDADVCRAAAGSMATALEGEQGWSAGAAAGAWAGLAEVLAERAGALARTLVAAVAAYLDHDARTAGGVGDPRQLPR
jgi:hypothetical protein